MSNIIDLLDEYKIIVPSIQRDYAYGRESEKETVNGFIDKVFAVLSEDEKKPFRLNYLYGAPSGDENKVILIDGQQRITTLFLIRLFLSVNSGNVSMGFAGQFSYETRTTSKAFCEFLSEHNDILKADREIDDLKMPKDEKEASNILRERLGNHKCFFRKWYNDPTVSSMITVLVKIYVKCCRLSIDEFISYLDNLRKIQFEFILLEGFKRIESQYTTMNGRGKMLTPFERNKADVFSMLYEEDPAIENTINNKWYPAFWKYALRESGGNYESAAGMFDRYLFNYFRLVLTMIWYEQHSVEKDGEEITVEKMIKWLKEDKAHADMIHFAMELFVDRFCEGVSPANEGKLSTEYDCHDNDFPQRTNIFGSPKLDFIKDCCENDALQSFNLLERCLLWTYIVYEYNKSRGMLNGKTLQDYYVLMRDVYAASWDSNTPTAITKNPGEHLVAKGVRAFRSIVDGKECIGYENQREAFWADNPVKYRILNNYCTRGCSNNLIDVIRLNGFSEKQAESVADNLDFLVSNCGIENIKSLEAQGFLPYFVNESNKSNRLYLPCTKQMLQSLFSMKSWTWNTWYDDFIKRLGNCKLGVEQRDYSPNEWQYYIEEYSDSFIFDQSLCAFDFEYNERNEPLFFETIVIYGLKATSRQTTSPYVLAALSTTRGERVNKDFIVECQQFMEKHKLNIEKAENCFLFSHDDIVEKIDDQKDLIQEIGRDIGGIDTVPETI